MRTATSGPGMVSAGPTDRVVTGPHPPSTHRHIRYRLANYRSLRGMTQQEVADKAGVTREYVCMIEGGRRRADGYQLLVSLATAIGVDVTALTTHRPGAAHEPPEQAATLRLNLHELSATVEPSPTGHVIVLSDGVLRVELISGPRDTAKQDRNGALRLAGSVGAYLRQQSLTEQNKDGHGTGVDGDAPAASEPQ